MIEKQAKKRNIKDLRKDIDYIKGKIESELKKIEEKGMEVENDTEDIQTSIHMLLGKLERASLLERTSY